MLRFVTADGRTIPQNGYRREDFVDAEEVDGAADTSNGMDSSPPTNRHLGARLDVCCTSQE